MEKEWHTPPHHARFEWISFDVLEIFLVLHQSFSYLSIVLEMRAKQDGSNSFILNVIFNMSNLTLINVTSIAIRTS